MSIKYYSIFHPVIKYYGYYLSHLISNRSFHLSSGTNLKLLLKAYHFHLYAYLFKCTDYINIYSLSSVKDLHIDV